MLDMDHKLNVQDDQALENVMYETRTNEQGLSNPDNKRINDNSPQHNHSEEGRILCRSK